MTQPTQQATPQVPTHPAALGPDGLRLAPEAAFVKTLEHFVQKANVFAALAAKQKIEPFDAFQHLNALWRDVAEAGERLTEPVPVAKPAALGLTASEARERLAKHGPNQAAAAKRITLLSRLFDAVKNPLVLLLFVGYITRFQILPEERILQARFGTPYQDYLRRVRRWL